MIRAFPMAVVVLALAMSLSSVTQPIFIPIHLVTFFLAAMVCHGELVRHRPSGEHLTTFYLAMSCGGVLGGLFNALSRRWSSTGSRNIPWHWFWPASFCLA